MTIYHSMCALFSLFEDLVQHLDHDVGADLLAGALFIMIMISYHYQVYHVCYAYYDDHYYYHYYYCY